MSTCQCGALFEPQHHHSKYCQPCKSKMKNKRNRRWRAKIQDKWGCVGGVRWDRNNNRAWVKSENAACIVLVKLENYKTADRQTIDDELAPFDIIGIHGNGETHCFQVTMRTHTEINNHKELAENENMVFHIMFMKPDLKAYTIKKAGPGASELSLNDLEHLKIIPDEIIMEME